MKVRFEDIPENGLHVDIPDGSWFPGGDVRHRGPVVAKFFLEKKDNRVLADGSLKVNTLQECDRCLEPYEQPLDLHFRIDMELLEDEEEAGQADVDHTCGDSEIDVIFLEEPVVDLGAVLEQQVYLALPAKRLCRPECKGLCPGCGVNLNEKRCVCSGGQSSSPFAVLEKLIKKT